MRSLVQRLQAQDRLNFWLTNRIPRRILSHLMGAFSRIENDWLASLSIRIWQQFADDLSLHEAEAKRFSSLRACFTRSLQAGARPIDRTPGTISSPCDAVIGAHGLIDDGSLVQAKGLVYSLKDLLQDPELSRLHQGGTYVTLRLKSSMYHRFHAPCAGRSNRVRYISGDVFNVNPPTLRRIPGVFCRNERAILPIEPHSSEQLAPVTLVPVAAVLVSSMRFWIDGRPTSVRRRGTHEFESTSEFARGDELGWFEHGSTIVLLAGPGLRLAPELQQEEIVKMGRALLIPVP